MKEDKTNPKYLNNPKLHYIELHKFKERLQFLLLGEQEKEWRGKLEFVLSRTEDKIAEVAAKLL